MSSARYRSTARGTSLAMTETARTSAPTSKPAPGREEPEIEEAFDRLVGEGNDRLQRPLLSLCATGFLGGIDVAIGVLAYLVVEEQTGSKLLAALAFSTGFIAPAAGPQRAVHRELPRPGDRGRGDARLVAQAGPAVGGHAGR